MTSSSSGSSGSSSGASSSSSSGHNFSAGGPNVVPITVGPGPTQASSNVNIPYASVTVCIDGTSTCTTIEDVLVDTGSSGLRLMASALNGLTLNEQHDPSGNGNVIAECLPFPDGYIWGPVATADITIGGEKASAVPINIIDDNGSFSPTVPMSCTSSGNSIGTIDLLGANGVLGVGLLSQDCGGYCAALVSQQSAPYYYYSCTASTCTPASEVVGSQVINPVALFATDNNGVILQLPSIPDTGANTETGYLVFGIGTESNNSLGTATVLTLDPSSGAFKTTAPFTDQTLSGFLDSGSNGLFFADSSIPNCPGTAQAMEFYCPTSTVSLSATNEGQNGAMSTVSFQIANLNNLSPYNLALDDIGGTATSVMGLGTSYFDFGLPFFYGRTVFTAINGMPPGSATGPYFAY